MKKPDISPVEVDMVPLIDIISLLLMFLIIVGDTSANNTSVKMKLPTADQAKTEDEWKLSTKNRIVIQLTKRDSDGAYMAKVNNKNYDTNDDAGKNLRQHLEQLIDDAQKKSGAQKRADDTWDIPVKLRIPEDAPMFEVEKVLKTVADLHLVEIQYAASGDNRPTRR
ncbi:MAG TPA: biopolymer transporter ExbD [Planctomycetota bacterium]|nr:biopolymer transporter ExbD [Planctomycetota bacterium]